jgi:hypothetical protein
LKITIQNKREKEYKRITYSRICKWRNGLVKPQSSSPPTLIIKTLKERERRRKRRGRNRRRGRRRKRRKEGKKEKREEK